MAKMYGITGKMSGKMGAAVFRIRKGQQLVTQYNPNVSNPNTRGQQDQRATFKLLTQLAAIMSPTLGGTMGVNDRPARTKRNSFFALNYPLVSVAAGADSIRAEIPMEQLQLTKSFRALPAPEVRAASGAASVNIRGIAADVSMVKLVVIGYATVAEGQKQAYVESELEAPVQAGRVETTISLPVGRYTILAYGVIPLTEDAARKVSIDDIFTPDDEDYVSAVVLEELAASGSTSETMTSGANVSIVE